MPVYFNRELEFPGYTMGAGQDGRSIVHHLTEWHPKFPLLAVASKNEANDSDGSVNFFHDEGDLMDNATIHRSVITRCMEWHPDKKIIAIGWASGEIITYNLDETKIYEQTSIHRSHLLVIRWNQSGIRLISGDKSGLLAVWDVDDTGRMYPTPLLQHRLHSAITHLVMVHPEAMARGSPRFNLKWKNSSVLEDFAWQKKSAKGSRTVMDPICCFLTTSEGALYFLNNGGDCVERCRLDSAILSLVLNFDVHVLSVVTTNMRLSQFLVTIDGQTSVTTTQVKLSGGQNKLDCIISVSRNILASCSNESVIRCWDFENNDNFVLDFQEYTRVPTDEVIVSIAFNPNREILAGGTNCGNVLLWKWNEENRRSMHSDGTGIDSSDVWEFLASTAVAAPALSIAWGLGSNTLAVNSKESVQVLSENLVSSHYNQKVSVVQINPYEAQVECHDSKVTLSFRANLHIKGVYNTKDNVAVWRGRRLEVYSINREKAIMKLEGSFHMSTVGVTLCESNVYCIDGKQINIRSFQGTVKQVIPIAEQEGVPLCLSMTGQYLVCGTSTGHVKLWDTGRREARLLGTTDLKVAISGMGAIISVQCNCNGTRVSIIEKPQDDDSDVHELALWFVDTDSVRVLNPNNVLQLNSQEQDLDYYHSEVINLPLPELPKTSLQEQRRLLMELVGRMPELHFWDPQESQLLAVEWSHCSSPSSLDKKRIDSTFSLTCDRVSQMEKLVSALFITPEKTFMISEELPQDPSVDNFLGISMPHFYFKKKASAEVSYQPSSESIGGFEGEPEGIPHKARPSTVTRITLRDFVGLEDSNMQILHAMVEFSYYSAVGNMDGAYKSIKLIKNQAVWESMARMCVKTQRLDVALVCLGNMGNARAAGAVRQAMEIPEIDARMAVLAVELGMLGDAEYLYKRSKRYDLLNQFYQFSGRWEKAMEIAETKDRIHLKTTYYTYARHAEEMGDIPAAVKSYEKANTHQYEVPRMLLDTRDLEDYVLKSQDRGIRKWWAEYLESMGEWEQAMQCYETAQDYYSMVRILCFNGQLDRAAEITEESGCKAAAYHLARRLNVENEDPRRTIHFFTKAQCYSPAIQIAKQYNLDGELVHLSLLSSQEDMLDSAKYYEENTGHVDKAILLYHKAGEISHAVDMCFKHHHFEMLDQIGEDLTESTDPELTQKVADYFMEKGLFDKAMEILLRTRRTEEALKLCSMHSVPLTEELVEKMTIPRRDSETAEETAHRVMVLEKLADCCLSLGAYHIAAKKFTQAGNKTKAMKALLKSGDTEKIIFFAGVSRQKDIYIMAANYLQTADWRKDNTILKNIISFYTKGRALESLSRFYDVCAQAEIDECQDYPKAAGALEQAIKVLSKVKGSNPTALEAKILFLQERLDIIKRFVEARSMYQSNPGKAIEKCERLLDENNLDMAVRVGDVYGLLIEHYAEIGKHEQAYSLMTEMKQRIPNVIFTYYVDIRVLEAVHSAMGVPLGRGMGPDQQQEEKKRITRVDEELEEDEDEEEEDENLEIDAGDNY